MRLSNTVWIAGAMLAAASACSRPDTGATMKAEQVPPSSTPTERDAEIALPSEDQIDRDANAIDTNNADAELEKLSKEIDGGG